LYSLTVPSAPAAERLVGADQQLLAGLAARIKRTRHLRAAEGAVVEQAAVFPAKGTPCATHWSIISGGDLSQAVYVGFTGTVVAAFDGIVKKAVYRIAVVAIVFGCIDAPCAAMECARRGLSWKRKNLDVVAQFAQ
jgi:hypothetical protein